MSAQKGHAIIGVHNRAKGHCISRIYVMCTLVYPRFFNKKNTNVRKVLYKNLEKEEKINRVMPDKHQPDVKFSINDSLQDTSNRKGRANVLTIIAT